MEWPSYTDEDQQLLSGRLTGRTVSMTYPLTDVNRPAMELLFQLCLKCHAWLAECGCYDRGYN